MVSGQSSSYHDSRGNASPSWQNGEGNCHAKGTSCHSWITFPAPACIIPTVHCFSFRFYFWFTLIIKNGEDKHPFHPQLLHGKIFLGLGDDSFLHCVEHTSHTSLVFQIFMKNLISVILGNVHLILHNFRVIWQSLATTSWNLQLFLDFEHLMAVHPLDHCLSPHFPLWIYETNQRQVYEIEIRFHWGLSCVL